jgi:hypothetical protein
MQNQLPASLENAELGASDLHRSPLFVYEDECVQVGTILKQAPHLCLELERLVLEAMLFGPVRPQQLAAGGTMLPRERSPSDPPKPAAVFAEVALVSVLSKAVPRRETLNEIRSRRVTSDTSLGGA